jgi:hypothetical protein
MSMTRTPFRRGPDASQGEEDEEWGYGNEKSLVDGHRRSSLLFFSGSSLLDLSRRLVA